MIKSFEELKERLNNQAVKKKVAVVAADDNHTLEAVLRAHKDGLIEPVLIGDEKRIQETMGKLTENDKSIRIIDIPDAVCAAEKACEMAKAGDIDCIMKGRLETGTLMKVVVNKDKGIRKSDTMSIIAFMESPYYHKVYSITDPGLLTYPNKKQKKDAIANAVAAYKALGEYMPKVAMIAALEKVNPKMAETVEAAEIKAEGVEGALIEGPISYDLAMDKEAARIKGYVSEVAGDADILSIPDIVSANIAAKSITVTGGGRTCGTVLGAEVPILIVSRSATADDKYMSIVVSALIGKG